ncbi:MAG TPA: cytochrome c biogenesis protein CcsA, partial [Verrucomicrobiae bacterium]|nr:cytochrome c biogenesis protein CcsA [Verrucomicrobiae bacterium]
MKKILRILPWCFLALFAMEIVGVLMPKKDGVFHLREFGRLPVLLNGRVQPFDSVGHNSLLQIRSTSDVPIEDVPAWKFWHHPKKLKSTEWLLEVMCQPDQADNRLIFLVHNPDLIGDLKLADKSGDKSKLSYNSGLSYYSFNELKPVLPEIIEQTRKAAAVDDQARSSMQRQVVKLGNAIEIYKSLKFTLRPPGVDDFSAELQDDIRPAIDPGVNAVMAKRDGKEYDKAAFNRIAQIAESFDQLRQEPGAGQLYPLVVPPEDPKKTPDDWGNIGAGVIDSIHEGDIFPPLGWLAEAATAYRDVNPAGFNEAVDAYTQWLQKNMPVELAKGRHEFFFNDMKPFLHAIIIYIMAFILTGGSLLTFGVFPNLSESLRRSAFYLIILAGIVHTFGLGFRMYLEGRPPVTNLYSSAIFIGWGAMILGLVLERVYRLGIGNAVASLAGFVTLLIAQNLAVGGDTMEMMRAVLDTNFWLATHVVVVTLGYASTFVAGLLAVIYIVLGVFTPKLSQKLTKGDAVALSLAVGAAGGSRAGIKTAKNLESQVGQVELGKALSKMVYAIVCFATLFSFVGTVLGGIWADQSWGRFWGWDPKENGALIIVLWNATILHARWGGMVRERGLMNMAIIGNIVTSWSWFGVNMLGIGLHSYGFMDAAFHWLVAFIGSQIILITLGLLPPHYWR